MATLNPQVSTGTIGDAAPSAGAHPANHKYYDREFIKVAAPLLIYDMFGDRAQIPNNSSNTMVVNKVAKLGTLEGSPISEGVTPNGQNFTTTRLEKSFNQYGGYAITTDRLQEETVNGITSEFNRILGEQAGETMNIVCRDDLLGSTNVRYAGAAANRDALGAATTSNTAEADLSFIYESFFTEKVKPFRPMTNGSPNTSTVPTRESFPVIVPVGAIGMLEGMDDGNGNTFSNTEKYAGQRATWMNEYGSYKHFSFILDTEASIVVNANATPQDVALGLVFGKGAYKTTTLAQGEIKRITKPLGSAGTEDPLDQRASMGWKAKKGCFVVQPTYMFRWEFSLGNN
jgi:N4-gp56 family major capsid protein